MRKIKVKTIISNGLVVSYNKVVYDRSENILDLYNNQSRVGSIHLNFSKLNVLHKYIQEDYVSITYSLKDK